MIVLDKVKLKVSAEAFNILHERIHAAESRGTDPYHAVRGACDAIGYRPRNFTETVLEIDYSLTGTKWSLG